MVSPQDLIRACESFTNDSRYKLRCFEGGGKFVQSTKLNDDDFYKQVLRILSDQEYLTASSLALEENISMILAKEELLVRV